MSPGPWVSPDQYRGIQAGLRVVHAWAGTDYEPEHALDRALRRESESNAGMVVGLATVARLLAIELAGTTGTTETAVLDGLASTVHRMQHDGRGSQRRARSPHSR